MNETIFWQLIADSKQASNRDAEAQVATLQQMLEALYAANWLCGRAEDWDRVPTDT